MRFKSPVLGFLLLMALINTHHVMAQTELPIELIELLGEIEDDDDMLGLALADFDPITNAATAPAGGSKK